MKKLAEDRLAQGWIEWSGGESPVDPGALVMVIYKSGEWSHAPAPASSFRWEHRGLSEDIRAYQIAV